MRRCRMFLRRRCSRLKLCRVTDRSLHKQLLRTIRTACLLTILLRHGWSQSHQYSHLNKLHRLSSPQSLQFPPLSQLPPSQLHQYFQPRNR